MVKSNKLVNFVKDPRYQKTRSWSMDLKLFDIDFIIDWDAGSLNNPDCMAEQQLRIPLHNKRKNQSERAQTWGRGPRDPCWLHLHICTYLRIIPSLSCLSLIRLLPDFPLRCLNYFLWQKTLTYKRSLIHRIVPDFIIQMGDITVGDGTGGRGSHTP